MDPLLMEHYVLDKDNKPVKAGDDLLEWVKYFDNTDRLLLIDVFPTKEIVSTVFLALPHPGGMFETLNDDDISRAETYEDILIVHAYEVRKRLWKILQKTDNPTNMTPTMYIMLRSLFKNTQHFVFDDGLNTSCYVGENYISGFDGIFYRRRLLPREELNLAYKKNYVVEWWDMADPAFDPEILLKDTILTQRDRDLATRLPKPRERK
jgi:hypothetical protein